ncbi:MAG: hypothetical protein U0804_05580 [Gemmataceae bacterium]
MAFHEFLAHVRAARSLMPPDVLTAGLAADPAHVRKALDSADVWLRPAFAEPFDPDIFPHPDLGVRQQLARDVEVLRSLAAQVGADGTATVDQRRDGLNALLRVIPAVRPFSFGVMTEELANHLWRLDEKYPDYVLGFECEFGQDWAGDPAVRVTAVIPEDAPVESERFSAFDRAMTQAVRDWVRDHARVEYWPYPSFRTPEDMRLELAGVDE